MILGHDHRVDWGRLVLDLAHMLTQAHQAVVLVWETMIQAHIASHSHFSSLYLDQTREGQINVCFADVFCDYNLLRI